MAGWLYSPVGSFSPSRTPLSPSCSRNQLDPSRGSVAKAPPVTVLSMAAHRRERIPKLAEMYASFIRFACAKTFRWWQRVGVHITPVHFYQPIPDTRALDDSLWARESELRGIEMNEAEQLQLLDVLAARYRPEYEALPRTANGRLDQFYLENGLFGPVDAEVLYSFVRNFRPRRVTEVGSGFSTHLTAQALLKNASTSGSQEAELTAIEPFPDPELRAGFPGLSRLIPSPVQQVPLSEFERLAENDILFLDSSHVLRIGSDVQYEFLEILPRLRPGVLVHIHDIFVPREYPKSWVLERQRFWNEQYLLQAWLSFNNAFEVIWAASLLHLRHSDRLQKAFPSYDPRRHWPGSFWIRRKSSS